MRLPCGATLLGRVALMCVAASLALPSGVFAASADSAAADAMPVPPVATIAAPRMGGYIQVRETAQKRVGLSALVNRGRFSMDGALPARFSYRFLVELEASAGAANPATVSLREAIIKWSPGPFAITAGQYKTPFSREYLIPVPQVETADLAAVVDSLAPKYDVGVMGEYAFKTYATVYAGVFNGEGQNAIANRDSLVMGVGRLVVTPIPQIAIGGNATYDGPGRNRWGGEVNLEQSGAVVRGEYIMRHVRGRPRPQDDFGWYVFGSYRVTPRVQAIARQEDFKRPTLGAARRVRATTLGTNIELAPNRVRLLLEGLRRYAGASQRRIDSFIAQLQVRF
jgi:hypothetical protein